MSEQINEEVLVSLPANQWGLIQPFLSDVASDFDTNDSEREAFLELDDAIENSLARYHEGLLARKGLDCE